MFRSLPVGCEASPGRVPHINALHPQSAGYPLMLSLIARILLTASSVAPVGLVYSYVSWYQGQYKVALICLLVASMLVLACLGILTIARKKLEAIPFATKSVEPADAESFGFLLLYILPLFTDRVEGLNWELWIPIVIVFAIIIGAGYGYHFNPLLGIMRWHFYKVTSADGVTYVLITRKHLRTAAAVHKVGQLTEYILIDLER
jgi:hypothetical protein